MPIGFQALFLVVGTLWCIEVFGRFRSDVEDLKKKGSVIQGVILFIWFLTLMIVVMMAGFYWIIVTKVIEALR